MPKKTYSVFLEESLYKKAADMRVGPDFKGVFTGYIESLITKDIEGSISPAAKTPIVELARIFNPTLAPLLEQQLLEGESGAPVNQARLVARFLEALHHALERDFNPNGTFQLWESEQVLKQAFSANPALAKFVVGGKNSPDLTLNEDKPPPSRRGDGKKAPGAGRGNGPTPSISQPA